MSDSFVAYLSRWHTRCGTETVGVNDGIPVPKLELATWAAYTERRNDLAASLTELQARRPGTLTIDERRLLEGAPDLIRQYGAMLLL